VDGVYGVEWEAGVAVRGWNVDGETSRRAQEVWRMKARVKRRQW
jgi:hypothetical protein